MSVAQPGVALCASVYVCISRCLLAQGRARAASSLCTAYVCLKGGRLDAVQQHVCWRSFIITLPHTLFHNWWLLRVCCDSVTLLTALQPMLGFFLLNFGR